MLAQLALLPAEVLLRIFDFLPYVSRSHLARCNKSVHAALQAVVAKEGLDLRRTWRVINVDHYKPTGHLWNVALVLDQLIEGCVFGSFIQKLICCEGVNGGYSRPRSMPLETSTIQATIEQIPFITDNIRGDGFFDALTEGNENAYLPIILAYATDLRQIDVPVGFVDPMIPFDTSAMFKSLARQNSLAANCIQPSPLHKWSMAFIMAGNGEEGPRLSDLYLLLALPSMRILRASQCHSEELPLERYDQDLPLSRIKYIELEDSALIIEDLKTFCEAIGVPCTMYHTWGRTMNTN